MPLSHKLPWYVAVNPFYDELMTRLSRYLRDRDGRVTLIDVGANIGDTITACAEHPADRFLAIEPNPHFGSYLRQNCGHLPNFRALDVCCSSADGESEFEIDEQDGTAKIRERPGGRPMVRKTLDSILELDRDYADFNFLKVDTDGHDFDVLRGASHSIARNHAAAVLFECDSFGSVTYVDDLLAAVTIFLSAGYKRAIFYDNFGYLFAAVSLDDLDALKHMLLYQLTSRFYYFDVLVIPENDFDAFLEQEERYFAESATTEAARQAARVALAMGPNGGDVSKGR